VSCKDDARFLHPGQATASAGAFACHPANEQAITPVFTWPPAPTPEAQNPQHGDTAALLAASPRQG
jgi:hypothetical protein